MNNENTNVPAGVVGAVDGQAVNLPSFTEDPSAYLVIISNKTSSRENLNNLAGVVASCMKEETNPQLAFLYLQAVAKQLPAEIYDIPMKSVTAPVATGVGGGVVGTAGGVVVGAVGAAGGGPVGPSEKMEAEMIRAQRLYEVLEAVGHAVVRCTNPRRSISHSGIIPALAKLAEDRSNNKTTINISGTSSNILSGAHVEFLQACIMAEHYRFAQRIVAGTWPRPNPTVSVRQVLRYFYLRGMMHMGCNDWKMAVRSFWTCLSIPADIVSSVSIAAWKKMILVQCLLIREDDIPRPTNNNGTGAGSGGNNPTPSSSSSSSSSPFASSSSQTPSLTGGPFALPKALPSCIARFLSIASSNPKKNAPASASSSPPPEDAHASHPGAATSGSTATGGNSAAAGGSSSSGSGNAQTSSAMNMVVDEITPGAGGGVGSSYFGVGARVYIDLAQAFLQRDRRKFVQIYQEHSALLTSDGNLAMIQQYCEKALFHRQLWHLSRIYAVIPLSQLAGHMDVTEDKMKIILLQLSMEKSWSIELQNDGMVVFHNKQPSPKHTDDKNDDESLEANVNELMELTSVIQKLDVSIATSPYYHALAKRANEARMGPRGVEDL